MGPYLRAEFLATVGDVSRFKNPGRLAAYAGPRDSGKTQNNLQRSRAGNHSLKRVFFQAAFASLHDLSLLTLLALVYSALRWVDPESATEQGSRRPWYGIALVSIAVFLLNKINYAPLLLVAAGTLVVWACWRRLLRVDVIAGVLVAACAPAAAWYVWVLRTAEFDQFRVVVSDSVLARLLTNWSDPAFWSAVAGGLNGWFFLPGLTLALVGLLLATRARSREDRVLLVWVAATFLYFYVVGPTLLAPHRYHFLTLLPIGCLLIGRVAVALERFKFGRWFARPATAAALTVCLALVLALGSWWSLRGYYAETSEEMAHFARAGEMIAANTDPGDLVVFVTEDWGVTLWVSYVAERRGWHNVALQDISDVVERGAGYAFVSSSRYAEKYSTWNGDAGWLRERPAEIEAAGEREVANRPEGTLYGLPPEGNQ